MSSLYLQGLCCVLDLVSVVDYTMEAGVGELRRRVYFQDDRSTFSGSLSLSSSKSICETLNVFVKVISHL